MTRRRAGLLWLVLAAFVACETNMSAHPAATTSIGIALPDDRRVDLTVASDSDALLAKLAALAGTPPLSGPLLPAECDRRLTELKSTLLDRLELKTGDGAIVRLALVRVHTGPDRKMVLDVSGTLPTGTRTLTMRSFLVLGSYALTVRRAGATDESVEWLNGPQWSQTISVSAPANALWLRPVVRTFALGFSHIVPLGLDHILFVLGLFLLNTRVRSILVQVTAFTVAHSVTLGLTLYGVVSLPASIVEPLIALSIVYVACENLVTSRLTPWRVGLVFAFGLLHGMGFAEALSRLNLAPSQFLSTLLTFNVGVEAGQLTVIALAAVTVRLLSVPAGNYRAMVVRPASLAIGLMGMLWVVERLI